MPDFKLIFTNRFVKDFRRLSNQNQLRVRRGLESLKQDPYKGRKLKSTPLGGYRIRVGDIRVLYDIEEENVFLLHVSKREDAYRKF